MHNVFDSFQLLSVIFIFTTGLSPCIVTLAGLPSCHLINALPSSTQQKRLLISFMCILKLYALIKVIRACCCHRFPYPYHSTGIERQRKIDVNIFIQESYK
ncbi:hypothetical protein IHE45_02G026500 [Dioscorea alata]|uniref:Uncharacterized protein n=1 Tax=Dioscorea alata TaxID=55571 RepID=A0ACB7WPV1_DIOAL|nr:hypothetical protein IHE45_02G026500 [Dioscorea alata]